MNCIYQHVKLRDGRKQLVSCGTKQPTGVASDARSPTVGPMPATITAPSNGRKSMTEQPHKVNMAYLKTRIRDADADKCIVCGKPTSHLASTDPRWHLP